MPYQTSNQSAAEDALCPKAARGIYQSLLDEIGEAVRLRDFQRYASHIKLPHRVETVDGSNLIAENVDLEAFFIAMQKRLATRHVEELTRNCLTAMYLDSETIQGCHDTRLVTRDLAIVDSYSALSTLVWTGGRWLVSEAQYVGPEGSLPNSLLKQVSPRGA